MAGAFLAELGGVVGPAYARPAIAADAIDDVAPSWVAEPGTVEQAAAVLALATRAGLAVVARGGASKLRWGPPPRRADLVLDTRRLDRVLEHAAGDLVVRAQAGLPLASLQTLLAGSGQWLALDPPQPGATLGGVVATGAAGPRRHRYGTARDLLIGLTVALADGTLAKAGGKVVKNVAGYDLGKLLTGSFGTLGIVVETTFRLHPLPAARRLVLADLDDLGAARAALAALAATTVEPSAVEIRWAGAPRASGRLAVLLESGPAGAAAQADSALRLLAEHGRARQVDDERVAAEWELVARPPAPTGPGPGALLRLSDAPARVPELIAQALDVARGAALAAELAGHAALGVLQLGLAGAEAALGEAVLELRRRLGGDASAVVLVAPAPLKRRLDPWGEVGDALPLMRNVKRQFDPDGTLAPGRFAGGL